MFLTLVIFFGGVFFGYIFGKQAGRDEYLAEIQRKNGVKTLDEVLKNAKKIKPPTP